MLARPVDQFETAFQRQGRPGGVLMRRRDIHALGAAAVCPQQVRAYAQGVDVNGYRIVSGGTDNHMMLIDLSDKPYTGKEADAALSEVYITANKNSVPNDPRSPFVTSGLRRFGVPECEQLAGWLCDVLDALESGGSERVAHGYANRW